MFVYYQGRTLSQIEQFWAYMLEGDKIVEEKDFEYSVLVSLPLKKGKLKLFFLHTLLLDT